jgi:hypothetical protein
MSDTRELMGQVRDCKLRDHILINVHKVRVTMELKLERGGWGDLVNVTWDVGVGKTNGKV